MFMLIIKYHIKLYIVLVGVSMSSKASVPVKKAPLFILYGVRKNQCSKVNINGADYYANISIDSSINNDQMKSIKESVNAEYKLYDAETLLTAPNGIYTWLLSDEGFFAIKVRNILELGTLHMVIAERTNSTNVYLSGELLKTNSAIRFNLLSGTYMVPLLKKVKNNSIIREEAMKLFNQMHFNSIENASDEPTYIAEDRLPLLYEDLLIYHNAGYSVTLYKDKENCISVDESGINIDTVQAIRLPKKPRKNTSLANKKTKGGRRRRTCKNIYRNKL